jgi:hypothetical protein
VLGGERFPFEFYQRWFEMYLGASLRKAGLEVTGPKPGHCRVELPSARSVAMDADEDSARGAAAPTKGGDSQPGEREWGEVRVGIAVFSTMCRVMVMTRTPSVGAMLASVKSG